MNGLAGTSKARSCRRAIERHHLGPSSRYNSWREVYLDTNSPSRQEDPETRKRERWISQPRLLTTFSVIRDRKRPWIGFRRCPGRTELNYFTQTTTLLLLQEVTMWKWWPMTIQGGPCQIVAPTQPTRRSINHNPNRMSVSCIYVLLQGNAVRIGQMLSCRMTR